MKSAEKNFKKNIALIFDRMEEHFKKAGLFENNSGCTDGAKSKELAAIGWNTVHSLLWNDVNFSVKEKETVIKMLTGYFEKTPNPEERFSLFCQRIVLAARYIARNPHFKLPLPSFWLDKSNENGYAVTARWMNEIETVRAAVPNHKKTLRVFAKAVLAYGESRLPSVYQFWRSYFIDHNEPELLKLFSVCAANYLLSGKD
jgi:hypothetical protein